MSLVYDNSALSSGRNIRYRNLSDNGNPSNGLTPSKSTLFCSRNKLHFGGPSSPIWRNLEQLVWEPIGEMVLRGSAKVRRILAYLFDSEAREVNPWLRDDLRVAANTLRYAHQGEADPFRLAFVSYFGTHPERAVPYWQERAAKTESWGNPKKPVRSDKPAEQVREKAAGAE